MILTFNYGTSPFSGYTAGKTLTIDNWSGTVNTTGGQDQFILSGLTSAPAQAFLDNITFTGGFQSGAAAIDLTGGSYEIVAVPEPTSIALLGSGALLGLATLRRRRSTKFAACLRGC